MKISVVTNLLYLLGDTSSEYLFLHQCERENIDFANTELLHIYCYVTINFTKYFGNEIIISLLDLHHFHIKKHNVDWKCLYIYSKMILAKGHLDACSLSQS